MSSESIRCPYCNASFPITAGDLAKARLTCTQCGDTFPNQKRTLASAITADKATLPSSEKSPTLSTLPEAKPMQMSNGGIARMILLIMLAMAIVGGTFMLMTQQFRRLNDLTTLPTADIQDVRDIAKTLTPASLPALSYLPEDCFGIAAFQQETLLTTDEGKDLWREFQKDFPLIEQLRSIPQKFGMALDQFDHIAVGVRLRDNFPEVFLACRTKQIYSFLKIQNALPQANPERFRDRPVYRIADTKVGNMQVWCADSQTLVIHIGFLSPRLEDLQAIQPATESADTNFGPDLTAMIKNRVPQTSFLWFAIDVRKTEPIQSLLDGLTGKKTDQAKLPINQCCAGIRLQKGLTLSLSMQAKDLSTAKELMTQLEKSPAQNLQTKIFGPAEDAKSGNDDVLWIDLQIRGTPAQLRQLLKKMPTSFQKIE